MGRINLSPNFKVILIIALFSLMLVSIWFKDRVYLATGEEGLFLNNPSRAIELYKYSWSEIGPGIAVPGANTVIPMYILESFLINLGFSIWFFQVTIFFLLLLTGSTGIYFLSKELLSEYGDEDFKIRLGLIAAIFYILNPISLIGVWSRFLLPFILFYSFLPFFLYLYIKGLKGRKWTFTLLVPLFSLTFVYAFAAPSMPLLLWFLPFLYTVFFLFSNFKKKSLKERFFPITYLFVALSFWILIHLWWIVPFIELSKVTFAKEIGLEHAVGTLIANSKDFELINVVRLMHTGILYRGEFFGSIYKSPFFVLISFVAPLLTILGLFKLKNNFIKVFFASSLLILLFLVKGTSPPLGEIFLWFFKKIIFLQVYRNPLEKIGLLLPIIYAPLFAYGLLTLTSLFKRKIIKSLIAILVISALILYNWPFFTGAIVNYGKRDIRVEVPESFNKANSILRGENHVIFSLPQMEGGTGIYTWKYKYLGVEPSEFLFNFPVMVKFFDANMFFAQLLTGVAKNKVDYNISGIAQIFAADIIALRKDTDVSAFGYNLDGIKNSEKMINKEELNMIFDSPEFSLWALPDDKKASLIYTPSSVKLVENSQQFLELLQNKQFDPINQTFICTNYEKCSPYAPADKAFLSDELILPPREIEVTKISPVNYNIKIKESSGKFILVFNNSFHPGWVVEIAGRTLAEINHFVANGYANGFIIENKGDFEVSLKFKHEENINYAKKISLLTIILGIVILLIIQFRKNQI